MFKIESYVTPILLSYVDKYVRDFKPADAQVSLWGGGVVLHNLVLKADVLQQEVALPFTLVSGRIHELLIQVPWTKIMSEPIVVTIDTIECVLSLNPPTDDRQSPEPQSRKTQVVEAPPGYMQALVRRIVSNIALRVHHLIVKYVQDDIVMSLNVKHLAVNSAGPNWEAAFADIDQNEPVIRRLVRLDDFTLCLDKADADGKIRFYQEPLLYRCQLDLRVLTRLISANTRRATSLNVQLRSSKLAWSVTNEQLILLLRLQRERPTISSIVLKPKPPAPKQSVSQTPLRVASANSAEPARSESWSEWAWSWLPTWIDREGGVEEAPAPASPLPLFFSAYLDDVSLVFKVMEVEANNRKRSRSVLELTATHAAVKSSLCSPTFMRLRIGARELIMRSQEKCVCGLTKTSRDEPSVYLSRIVDPSVPTDEWKWPEEDFNVKVDTAEVVDETFRGLLQQSGQPEGDSSQGFVENKESAEHTLRVNPEQPRDEADELWAKMAPLFYVDYSHERSPPRRFVNPYDNPPKDFQYSDWVEACNMTIKVEPVELQVSMGLIHRLNALMIIYQDRSEPQPDDQKQPMRVLTVEECESLSDNLPQKRIHVEARGIRVRIIPWDHKASDRPLRSPVVLDLDMPKTSIAINGPLYPDRVCQAACQMPDDVGPIWQGARLHVTLTMTGFQAGICSPTEGQQRTCTRADLRFVTHTLLKKKYFTGREFVQFGYHLKIKELSICGSSARLQTAVHVPLSLYHQRRSAQLKHTSLTKDALQDEEAVAIDFTIEDLAIRGFVTKNINTHVVTLQSAKATAFHEPKRGELKQAWLFSAPDAPTTTPYLRVAIQWCNVPMDNSFDYLGAWAEPMALSIDPLVIAWLAYKPQMKSHHESSYGFITKSSSWQIIQRRRPTPPSSSGRGVGRTGSGAELVHIRSRSGSEPSEKKEYKMPLPQSVPPGTWWSGERLVALHTRLRYMLFNVELGVLIVYVTLSTANALDCVTMRDAMERHASASHRVLGISLGRLSVHSNATTNHLWQELQHDGPTFVKVKPNCESFPWKITLVDASCYTLQVPTAAASCDSQSQTASTAGLKSRLRVPSIAVPRTVLELVTTTITVSVATKSIQYKTISRKDIKKSTMPEEERSTRYFTSGSDFRPSTLKEFVRGPAGRRRKDSKEGSTVSQEQQPTAIPEEVTIKDGPVISLGVHLHADTPPIIIRLEHDQIHVVSAALHCFNHIITLLKQAPVTMARSKYSSLGGSHKSLIRSVSELEEIPSVGSSDSHSELNTIFDRAAQNTRPLKTFFWFQWVVSRATLVVASRTVKLVFVIDDIISTGDIQPQYNQLKIKLASATVKYYEREGTDKWSPGVLGGRVLEAREPTDVKEDTHFLAITITQAQISNLPASWKEELHPKLLEQKGGDDDMWEIYAMLAPLEAVVQPVIMDNIMSLVKEMSPRAACSLRNDSEQRGTTLKWPFCYIATGGLRLLVTGAGKSMDKDDTFMLTIGKVNVNPHPNNPIYRRTVSPAADGGWVTAGAAFEGRQYEIMISNVSIKSAQLKELLVAEKSDEYKEGTVNENPALKWSQKLFELPTILPILHSVDVSCVLAPALYMSGALACGPAVEVNLVSDCSVELSIAQLVLLKRLIAEFTIASQHSRLSETDKEGGINFAASETDKDDICPYPTLFMKQDADTEMFDESVIDSNLTIPNEAGSCVAGDSGVETIASSSRTKATDEVPLKKPVSVVFMEKTAKSSEYLELFLTMGVIELALYVADDGSPEVTALRPPRVAASESQTKVQEPPPTKPQTLMKDKKPEEELKRDRSVTQSDSHSLTELVREADVGQTLLEIPTLHQHARKFEGNLPLLQVTLFQPNLYYWKRKTQKTILVSLFNAWVGLGAGQLEGQWHAVLLSTAKGVSDPVTDIPPALATLKVSCATSTSYATTAGPSTSARGTVSLDVERPVLIEVSTDRLKRIKGIIGLLEKNLSQSYVTDYVQPVDTPEKPSLLYNLRKLMLYESMESITIQTSQIGVCGSEGTVGWDSASLQLSVCARPDRMNARSLITALVISAGPPGDRRHVVMQPLIVGMQMEAYWEAWRRTESGVSARKPSVRIGIEFDRVTFDLRPQELTAGYRLQKAIDELIGITEQKSAPEKSDNTPCAAPAQPSLPNLNHRLSPASIDTESITDHYYKDDLRSGAFKILSGGQLPMAYQVMLHENSVSWRYPHPRAITRVVAFPLPGQDEEIDCVLELFTAMLDRWEPHTYFKIPVGEPRELQLFVSPPDAVFAIMWRFRACTEPEPTPPPYEFDIKKFTPRSDPLVLDHQPEQPNITSPKKVTAEELSGVLRVDSYFAPSLLPRTKIVARVAHLQLHVHNTLPNLSSQATCMEGYYVSKPLMRSHRVLSVTATNTATHAHVSTPAGRLFIVDTNISCDIVDCATGTMEELVEGFRLQCGVSSSKLSRLGTRTRLTTSGIHVALQVPRLRTLQALGADWFAELDQIAEESSSTTESESVEEMLLSKHAVAAATALALEGRVSLWIHNSCGSALRVGQEGTDEVVPLGPGARLAYRWRNPTAPKKLRVALAGPTADWHWSSSLPFIACNTQLRVEDAEILEKKTFTSAGVFLHVKVKESGANRYMHLSGRLVLANMMRYNLLYKVRAHVPCPESKSWRTVCSGELAAETVGRSVVCSVESEMVLKIKFCSKESGWSGDIPLKECPKENVPWLVKVPGEGEVNYVSVWCRVVRARSDGRILATVWPLYVLHSHLPLDTDVLIVTESTTVTSDDLTPMQLRPPPRLQTAPGRGVSTHLMAPGTTAARHSLSFQYKDIECPVTREAVPLHYGMTNTSVFDKRAPVSHIEDVIKEILRWLERSGRNATTQWPYSLVAKHYLGEWRPALYQPRCDVTVRYQAVRAGGGCSLEIQLCPVVLLCNATSLSLTLRAHDAAPLCKLEPGAAISPPSGILKKPFFMSLEMGRETFVSYQLQVTPEEPGRYGALPPGYVGLDHSTNFSIVCNHKVALLTLHYEIKEEINILGVTSTFVLINRLDTDLLVSAIAVPSNSDEETALRAKTFKVVPPTKEGSIHGTCLSRFYLRERWRGGNPSELRLYLCLSLPSTSSSLTRIPVPIRLGEPPVRRAVALYNAERQSVPIVVTQMKHDNRWLIVVARDPCPQFVVQNHTRMMLTVGQPMHMTDEPTTSQIEVVQECAGARWCCMVPPNTAIHYSTPSHCARYPPQAPPPHAVPTTMPSTMTFLSFARGKDETELEWSSPVAAAAGEHLLQFFGDVTVKLRVRTNPHSTLLELQDVDHNDISASDIRRRLFGAFMSSDSLESERKLQKSQNREPSLPRVGATCELLRDTEAQALYRTSSLENNPRTSLTRDLPPNKARNVPDDDESIHYSVKAHSSDGIKKRIDNNSVVMFFEPSKTKRSGERRVENQGVMHHRNEYFQSTTSVRYPDVDAELTEMGSSWSECERLRCVISGIAVEMSASSEVTPLFALHLDRTALLVLDDKKKTKTILSIADAQIDNLQYDTGQYDFAVVASTRAEALAADRWPPLWNMFAEADTFATRQHSARLLLKLQHDKWTVIDQKHKELTEVEIKLGTLALYVEDAYVKALVNLSRLAVPSSGASDTSTLSEERSLQSPLRLRLLHIHPLDLTLTLHTAVRMYIALDQSPLRLSAFKLHDMMLSAERLTHALTVHYLSAAILGAGWVVGGLELLGAPGALAARVGGATGGVRGVASAAAAALLRSLSAWAGSLARNLDLLAGDEEHARRAAAARRRPPPSFVAGLVAGITNFAINILGAVGGLAHHPLVGVAVGETESGAAALRRGILGALTKPLSATADLVAYAGTGLLRQTGWDPVPEPRRAWPAIEARATAGWHRDCVRWMFRLCELTALAGFEVLIDNAALQLLLTHKFLVVADRETERIVEMIDLRFCTLMPYAGQVIELCVTQRRQTRVSETKAVDEDDEYQISAAAMARVARYTGAKGGTSQSEMRVLSLMSPPGCSFALHAALAAAVHHNADSHFSIL